jgi:hypothetical protein
MAVNLQTSARNGACNGVVDLLDVGSANPAGLLRIGTTAMGTILAQLNFSNPAFGAALVGVATAASIADDTSADNTGTAAAFDFQDRDRAGILSGSVGTSGADINLNTVSITAGDTVSITSMTVTMPAS